MTTLITGGTGFLGAEVARLLIETGKDSLVLFDVDLSTKRLGDLVNQVELVQGDLGDFSQVLNVVKTFRPRVIYHFGGMLSVPSEANPSAAMHVNVLGTFHLLEAARLFDVSQVLFSSTAATYSLDILEKSINDYTLQRPQLLYGATKLFCEHLGLFYKRKYGLDFRAVRYPSIVGPGVRTPGVVQYTSWVIEESAKGNPYTIYVNPETRCPVIYFKDAARAMVKLAEAPAENIKMVNYVVAGAPPIATAQGLVAMVKARIPTAQIDFKPDLELQKILDKSLLPLDDSMARREWGWKPEYDQARIVDDFIEEMKRYPERYR